MNINLSPQIAKGMFGATRMVIGNYDRANINQTSGVRNR
jgi:hypothetical protein